MTSQADDRTHASPSATASADEAVAAWSVAQMPSAPSGDRADAPRINALQKLWLREIGIEKTWLKVADPQGGAESQPPTAGVAGRPGVTAGGGVSASGAAAAVQDEAEASSGNASMVDGLEAATADSAAMTGASVSAAGGGVASRGSAVAGADAARGAAEASRTGGRQPAPAVAGPSARPATGGAAPAVRALQPETQTVVAATDFEALREQVQQCTACGLCQGRRHAVFGMGARPARWMIVGEGPGEQEDRQGLPFVGRSGQLLDAMLNAVGMSRADDVFITNVIKCRPPGNRNPKPEEIAACNPYLKRQIELIRPERILVVGRFAAQTLLGTDATIGSLRGRAHEWRMDDGHSIPVIVSYHPAYLLRSPVEKARAWQDLQLAVTLQ